MEALWPCRHKATLMSFNMGFISYQYLYWRRALYHVISCRRQPRSITQLFRAEAYDDEDMKDFKMIY